MKKMKVVLILILAVALLALSACGNGGGNEGDNGYQDPVTLPETLPEELGPDDVHELTEVEIIVNGMPLTGVSALTADGDIWPTHVPLPEVAYAMGVTVTGAGEEIALEGLYGPIWFIVGSNDFTVNDEVVTLAWPSIREGGTVYVPITFFREVFGAGAFVDGGTVVINSETNDMQ